MEVEFSSNFLKKAKKLTSNEKKRLSERVEWFRKNPHDPRLKTHPLTGKLEGIYSFSVTHTIRAIFVYPNKKTALFVDVGTHEEVYKKS